MARRIKPKTKLIVSKDPRIIGIRAFVVRGRDCGA
jgi:hypothetical protein